VSARAHWRRERTEAAVAALVANGLPAKEARTAARRVLRAADRAVPVAPLSPEREALDRRLEMAESSAREWLLELTRFVTQARALREGLEHVEDLVARRRRYQTISEALDAALSEPPAASDPTDELLVFRIEAIELALELGLPAEPGKPDLAWRVLATKIRPRVRQLLREQALESESRAP